MPTIIGDMLVNILMNQEVTTLASDSSGTDFCNKWRVSCLRTPHFVLICPGNAAPPTTKPIGGTGVRLAGFAVVASRGGGSLTKGGVHMRRRLSRLLTLALLALLPQALGPGAGHALVTPYFVDGPFFGGPGFGGNYDNASITIPINPAT